MLTNEERFYAGRRRSREEPVPADGNDVTFIRDMVQSLPAVMACGNILDSHLFGCGVSARKEGWALDDSVRFEFATYWTEFGIKVRHGLCKYGIAVWDLAPHPRLRLVPMLLEFEHLEVSWIVDEWDVRHYEVKKRGKLLKNVYVIDKYPPERDGRLTSPMARLIPSVKRLIKTQRLYDDALESAIHPQMIFEQEEPRDRLGGLTKGQLNAQVPTTSVGPVSSGSSGGGVTFLDLASDFNRSHPRHETSEELERRVREKMDEMEHPAAFIRLPQRVQGSSENQDILSCPPPALNNAVALVLKPGFKLISSQRTRNPFIPDLKSAEKSVEDDTSAVFLVPRVYWAEMETRFKVEMQQSRDRLRSTIRQWSTFLIETFQNIWSLIYGTNDVMMATLYGAPETRISLPSTTQLYEFEYMLQYGIMTTQEFQNHVAGLFGWGGQCGDLKEHTTGSGIGETQSNGKKGHVLKRKSVFADGESKSNIAGRRKGKRKAPVGGFKASNIWTRVQRQKTSGKESGTCATGQCTDEPSPPSKKAGNKKKLISHGSQLKAIPGSNIPEKDKKSVADE